MYPISGFKDLASSLVAWGTLMLAAATFTLIQYSREQEKTRRKDELSKEKRDRDERLFNEVIQWATDVASCRVEIDIKESKELQYRYEEMLIRSRYINNIIEPFAPSLRAAVDNLIKGLSLHIKLIKQYNDLRAKGEQDKRKEAVVKIRNHNAELSDRFVEVIDEATTAKLANI